MQDRPTERDVAAEFDQADRSVLHMLLDRMFRVRGRFTRSRSRSGVRYGLRT
jgi:hypothetical protein